MEHLDQTQRPELLFLARPKNLLLAENDIEILALKCVLDGYDGYPLTVDLETHYYVKSKIALAASGLPTPKYKLVEPEG